MGEDKDEKEEEGLRISEPRNESHQYQVTARERNDKWNDT